MLQISDQTLTACWHTIKGLLIAMPQIPSLSLLRECLQNSLINHRNQKWKLGHLAHTSHPRCAFAPCAVLLSALSQQPLNDLGGEVSPDSPGSTAHPTVSTGCFPPTSPIPSTPVLPLSDLSLSLLLSSSGSSTLWVLLQLPSSRNCCSGNVPLSLL